MNAKILESTSSPPSREVISAEPALPTSSPARRWRLSLSVSLGVLLLLATLTIAALSLRSHAGSSSTHSTTPATPADDLRWASQGYVDIEGGVTPLYPSQPGRVEKIVVRENEPVKAGQPLFYVEDNLQLIMVREAEADLEGARRQLTIAETGLEEATKQIEAQKIAIELAQKKVELARILRDKQKRLEEEEIGGAKETLKAAEIAVKQAEAGVQGEQAKIPIMEAAKQKTEGYVAAAQSLIKGKQAQLDKARNAVTECVVRAPVDGTPLRVLVTVGQVLGSNPRQPAIQFAAERPLLVRAEVEQEFVGRVRKDQNVIIEDNVTGQECARGKVVSLARWYAPHRTAASGEMLMMTNEVRTLECIVHIEPTTSREIRIGQRVRVQFTD